MNLVTNLRINKVIMSLRMFPCTIICNWKFCEALEISKILVSWRTSFNTKSLLNGNSIRGSGSLSAFCGDSSSFSVLPFFA